MRYPLKYKLASIILVILVPLLIFSVYHYLELLGKSKERINAHNREIAKDITQELDELVEKSFGVLRALAEHPAVKTKNSRECDQLFARLLPAYPSHLNILAADMDGYNYGSGVHTRDMRTLNYIDREWFREGSKGVPIAGNLHISKLLRMPAVMLAMPVFDGKGKQVGVLGFPLDLAKISARLAKSWHLPDHSVIRVIDAQDRILVDTLNRDNVGKNLDYPSRARTTILDGTETLEERNGEGIPYLYSFASLSKAGWRVIVGVPAVEANRQATESSRKYLLILIGVALSATALSIFFSRRISANIASLIAGLREIEQGNLHQPLQLPGTDELTDLATSFNHMTEERLKADRKLKESEAFLSSVLNGIGEGVVVVDRNYRLISANNGYCRQVKIPLANLIGRTCHEISHHSSTPCYEIKDGCECAVKRCFETGKPHRTIHTHYDNHNKAIYIETNAYPLLDEGGTIGAAIETLVDVSDRLLMERHLEEVKEKYRKLYDDAPDMMQTVDRQGNILICNRTEAQALGYTPEEIIGKPFSSFVTEENREHCAQHFETIKNSGYCETEMTLLAKNGQHIPVLVKAKAMHDDNGACLMADMILRDITEKKVLEAQLVHAQKMEALGTLTGGVAHDFNNILTAIIGFSELLRLELNGDEKMRHDLQQIMAAAERGASLTQSLLAFSRKQPFRLKSANLNVIVSSLEKLLAQLVSENITLRVTLTDGVLPIMADSGQVGQVLMNLAANARDAMPAGGRLTIETQRVTMGDDFIKIHGYGSVGDYAQLTVTDNGSGMDEKTRARVFEPFFTTKGVGKGTGLGLSIVYGIITQHHGHINVYSELGKGTVFRLYIPLTEPTTPESAELDDFAVPRGSGTILVAEDDPKVRELVTLILTGYGYRVLEALNGTEAVRLFVENAAEIRLVILDAMMPVQNGKEAFLSIREMQPEIRAIFMSGYTANVIQEKMDPGEELNFISKPFAPKELLGMVARLLKD